MKTLTLLSLILGFVNCMTLAPLKDRKTRAVSKINGFSDTELYNRALVWFAKNTENANWSIQMKDEKTKRILANLSLDCRAISPFMPHQNVVSFSVDFQAKDGRYRFTSENIAWKVYYQGQVNIHGPFSLDGTKEIDTKCIAPLRASFKESLLGNNKLAIDDNF